MALDTYANLKTEIAGWMSRSDLTTPIDTFIDLAEAAFNRSLRVRQMEGESTATATEYMSLPTDFLEMRDIEMQTDPRRQLRYVTPAMADRIDTTGTTGVSENYTIVGNEIRLIPAPDSASYTVRMSYWRKITPLDGTNTSNAILARYPDLYLFGALTYARAFIQDPTLLAIIKDTYENLLADVNREGRRSNVGGDLRMRSA